MAARHIVGSAAAVPFAPPVTCFMLMEKNIIITRENTAAHPLSYPGGVYDAGR